jgi:hypothetical protein
VRNNFIAFMGGVTGAGLFGKLRRPGAPTEFIDSRTVEDYLAGGEFEETLQLWLRGACEGKPPDFHGEEKRGLRTR